MGSQLPDWAQRGRSLAIPTPPRRPGALVQILGADISEWQGATNLSQYNRQFIIIREQYGTAALDRQFARNRDQARSLGLARSFYHYAYPQYNSPESEADTFANGTDWRPGEGAVLDFEESYGDPVGWSLRFLRRFEADRGFKPMLYINVYTLYSYNWAAVAANGNGLWAAQWNFNQSPPPSGAFAFAAAKQYTDADSVSGIGGRVDGDVFYGDAATFQRYGATGSGPAAPAPQPPATPGPGAAPNGCVHTVQPGETLSSIAGSRWPQVAAGNGIGNPNLIFVGQRINLCATGAAAPASAAGRCVTVRSGDTLSRLFPNNWRAVASRNGIRNPDVIFVGQRICA